MGFMEIGIHFKIYILKILNMFVFPIHIWKSVLNFVYLCVDNNNVIYFIFILSGRL